MNDSGERRVKDGPAFQRWVGALVVAYIAVGIAGWTRTLLPDEIRPLILAASPPSELLELARSDIVQTPLSYFVAQAWLTVFGHTDTAAKALALVIGVATLIVFAFLARSTTSHWRLATLLCCLIYLRVGTSPNLVRMYGLLVLLAAASLLAWHAWRRDPRVSRWLVWAALSIAAIYTHPSALLLVGATAIATAFIGPKRLAFAAAAALPLLAILPWVAFVLPVYESRGIKANVAALADDPIRETALLPFYFLTGDPPGGASPLEIRYGQGDWSLIRRGALVLAAAFVLGSLVGLARRRPVLSLARDEDARLLAHCLLVAVPAGVLLAVSLVAQPVLSARYLLASLPPLLLLIADLTAVAGRPGRIVTGVIAAWLAVSAGYSMKLNRVPSFARESARYIDERFAPDDLIIAGHHWAIGWEFFWEWRRRLGRTEPLVILPGEEQPAWLRDILPPIPLDSLDLAPVGRIWYLSLRKALNEPVEAELEQRGFQRVVVPDSAVRNLHFLVLFQKRPGEPGGPARPASDAMPVVAADSIHPVE